MPQTRSTLAIARALIAFPSVTPADAGALPYLRDLLAGAGFKAELVTFSAPGAPDVLNLYARFGRDAPNLAFAGHTDVVPAGDAARWRFPPFSAEIADGSLWGRGACDMKGGLAAAVAAALGFVAEAAFAGSISFLVTGDEEGPSINGTAKLLDWALARGEAFDHCIVGEPTSVENARRHDQARTARLADRAADAAWHAGPRRLSAHRRQSAAAARAGGGRAVPPAARRRQRRFRSIEPRGRDRRRRQSRGERDPGRGAPRLQRALQRPLDAGDAEGGDRATGRGRRRRWVLRR